MSLKYTCHYVIVALTLTLFAGVAHAQTIWVDGTTLYYDTTENADGIVLGDEEKILEILKTNPDLTDMVLNSTGGSVTATNLIADYIIDVGLNTHVENECASACPTIFLAGKKRTLAIGAQIGFHRSSWKASNLERYYEAAKERRGWSNFFEFAAYLHADTQEDIFNEFEYLLERGVEPLFAIRTLRAEAGEMWYPRRKELKEGGFITE